MENKSVYFDHQFHKIERIIEKEVEMFFHLCVCAAYELSVRIAKDTNIICEELFENNVVSKEDINELLFRIHAKICDELKIDNQYVVIENKDTMEKIDPIQYQTDFLMKKEKEYKATQFTAHIAENIICNSFSHVLGNCSSSSMVEFVSGYAGFGKWVLGKNNKSAMRNRFQKNIYQTWKGTLINIKTKIKTELLMEWEYYFEMQEESIAI